MCVFVVVLCCSVLQCVLCCSVCLSVCWSIAPDCTATPATQHCGTTLQHTPTSRAAVYMSTAVTPRTQTYTETDCNKVHTAAYCNTVLQHPATQNCNTHPSHGLRHQRPHPHRLTPNHTLQHTTTHCNTTQQHRTTTHT